MDDLVWSRRSIPKLGNVTPGSVALLAFIVLQAAGYPILAPAAAELVVIQEEGSGRPRVVLGIDPKTSQPYVRLAGRGMPAYPTIDVTCDRKLRTIPLTRSEEAGEGTVAAYEMPQDIVGAFLRAGECRLFVPGNTLYLPRQQLWKAWADPSKGVEAPKVLQARVVGVIDGDTIKVTMGDRTETVRYIGINTPETNHPTRGVEPGGREATEVNRTLAAGRQIRLELDVQERDRYGRLLAYVYVGDQMVNAELLRRGYAQVMTIPPNVRYQDLFLKLQREAREQKRGLWAEPLEPGSTPPPVTSVPQRAGGRAGATPESAWTCPTRYPIKGNFTTYSGEPCIYHVPGGAFYDKTKPERCYATEEEARKDRCRRSRR